MSRRSRQIRNSSSSVFIMNLLVKQLALMVLFLCIHSASGLQCLSCGGRQCSPQTSVNCSRGETHCFTRIQDSYTDWNWTHSWIYKGCASSQTCNSTGNQYVSYNYGFDGRRSKTTCCDGDNCNTANFTLSPPAGSLQCYGCHLYTSECRNVTCNALETCFTGSGYGRYYGCVSKNVCSNPKLFPYSITSSSCCNTSLCNAPESRVQCMTCSDATCSSQRSVTCATDMCHTLVGKISYRNGNNTQTYESSYKGCASPQMCRSTESHFVSFNSGSRSHLSNSTCCDTDNCNAANLTLSPPAGLLQCYGCHRYTSECTNVTCNALETCFTGNTGYQQYYGCVSENVCSNPNLFPYYITSSSCCNTSLCNAPESRVQCMTCSDDTCSSQRSVTCATAMCHTLVTKGTDRRWNNNHTYEKINKGCASPQICTSAGSQYVSYNSGSRSHLSNSTCCDTDNCNAANLTLSPSAGSLQCYGYEWWDKYINVTCNTDEVCFTGVSRFEEFHGCAYENLCYDNGRYDPFYYEEKSCCNTTNCNDPTNTVPPTTNHPPSSSTPITDGGDKDKDDEDDEDEDEDLSFFSTAGQVLPLSLPLFLLGLCSHFLYF